MPPGHEYPISPPPAPEVVAPQEHGWTHRHPYIATSIAISTLLFMLLFVIASRSGVDGNQEGRNWITAGSIFFSTQQRLANSEGLKAQESVQYQAPETDLGYIPITKPSDGIVQEGFGNDLTALLAQLIQPQEQGGSVNIESSGAYTFIPRGLVSATSPSKQLSPEAEALQTYGNDIGTYIQGFEAMHSNAAQILKDHAEDRGNASKAEKVSELGYAMAELGRDLNLLTEIPKEAQAAHSAFATSYRIAGTNLTKIAETQTDEEFLDAIAAYNTSVEALSRRFFVLIGIFSANNVTFAASEPGSIFMFNPTFTF